MNLFFRIPLRFLALASILFFGFSALAIRDAKAEYDGIWMVSESRDYVASLFGAGKEPQIWDIYTDKNGLNIYIHGKAIKFTNVKLVGAHATKSMGDEFSIDIIFEQQGFKGNFQYYNSDIPVTGKLSPHFQKARAEAAKLTAENRTISEKLTKREALVAKLKQTVSDSKKKVALTSRVVTKLRSTITGLKQQIHLMQGRIESMEGSAAAKSREYSKKTKTLKKERSKLEI